MKNLFTILLILSSTAGLATGPTDWNSLLLEKILPRLPKGVRLELRGFNVNTHWSKGTRIVSVSPEVPLGLVSFEIEEPAASGWRQSQAQGHVIVRAFAPVAIARVSLSHGEKLNASAVRFEERELGRLVQSGYFLKPSLLKDRRTRGFVAAGQVINRSNSETVPIVVQGETVDLIRRRGGLKLVAKVRAMQNAVEDQWIQVQNPSSGKTLLARATGPGQVEVR